MPLVRLITTSVSLARIRSTASLNSPISREPFPVSGSRTWMWTNRRAGPGRLDGRIGDLPGGDRDPGMPAHRISRPGDRAGHHHLEVHGRTLPG